MTSQEPQNKMSLLDWSMAIALLSMSAGIIAMVVAVIWHIVNKGACV